MEANFKFQERPETRKKIRAQELLNMTPSRISRQRCWWGLIKECQHKEFLKYSEHILKIFFKNC